MSAQPRVSAPLTTPLTAAVESIPAITPGTGSAVASTASGGDLLGFDVFSLARSAAQLRVK